MPRQPKHRNKPLHSILIEALIPSSTSHSIPSWVNPSRRIGHWGYDIQADFYRVERQEWICAQEFQSSPNAVWWYDGLYRNYQTLEDFMFRQAEYIHSTVKIM